MVILVVRIGGNERMVENSLPKRLREYRDLSDGELTQLIEGNEYEDELMEEADAVRRLHYGTDVYIRGLIELTNYCKNDCYYCGIRKGNGQLTRYRLSMEDVLACCATGYELGFRTFVLQGGEDLYFTDERICEVVAAIRSRHPDCAITLSLGEKSYEGYLAFYEAGATRYLLRHETANPEHYGKLHPSTMDGGNRQRCLWDIKKIGYQVGSGFMVGSPYQTTACLLEDVRFLQELNPDMIGIGPYLSHKDTPFAHHANGDLHKCLRLVSILRLLFPHALIPATTALGTIDERGRERGLLAGANVVMPNLSPTNVRSLYSLYDNKIHTMEEAAESRRALERRAASIGYRVVTHVGHVKRD